MYNCKYTLCKHRANRGAASLFRLLCGPRAHVRLSGGTPDPRAGPSSAAGPPCALEGQWMRPLRHGTSNTRAGPSSAVGPACSMEGTLGLAHPLSQGQRVHCGVSSTLGLYRLGVGGAFHPRSRNNQHVSKCCRISLADKNQPW